MLKFISVAAVAVLAVMAAIPASAIHKGPCHGAGCDGGGTTPPPPEVTLDVLGCSVEGQVAKIVSGEWACAADVDTTIPNTDTLGDLSLVCSPGDIAKFDGAVWNCESGAPPDGGIGILVDDDGATIGKIVSITAAPVVTVDVVIDFLPDQILLRVERVGGTSGKYTFRFNGAVYFESSDCTGIGYILENKASPARFFDSSLWAGFVVGQDTIDFRRLYIPSDDPPTPVTTFSQLGGGCNGSDLGSLRFNAVRAILLEPDLHTAYPEPYSVVLF